MLVDKGRQGRVPMESHTVMLYGSVGMMQARAEYSDLGMSRQDGAHPLQPTRRNRNDVRIHQENERRARMRHAQICSAREPAVLAAPDRSKRDAETRLEHRRVGRERRDEPMIVDHVSELEPRDEIR